MYVSTLAKEGFNADLYIFDKKNQSKRLSTCSNKSYLDVHILEVNEGNNINVTTDDLFAKDKVEPNMLGIDKGGGADVSLEKQSTDTTIMESKEIKKLEIKVKNCVPKSKPRPASAKINLVAAAAKESATPVSTTVVSLEVNNGENEDSINLTIGEDEKNLLQDEDLCRQNKLKDENTRAKSSGPVAVTSADTSVKQEISENCTEEYNTAEGTENSEEKNGSSATPDDSTSVIHTKSSKQKDEKDAPKKQSNQIGISRNLWVSGLASTARATDLKQVFSKHGKVVGAKVVTNAKTPGARCYGYVTMATNEDATKCIHHLHRTELHGRMISVEKAKSDNLNTLKRTDDQKSRIDISPMKKEPPEGEGKMAEIAGETNIDVKIDIKKEDTEETKIDNNTLDKTKNLKDKNGNQACRNFRSKRNNSDNSRDHERSPHRNRKSGSRSESARGSNKDKEKKMVLSFKQIRDERDRYRLREKERVLREDERRQREEMLRNREVERRQREEAQRLKKEREKLQMEREKIERERANILKFELERQKLERDRLEFEKMELKRQQLKIAEAQRNAIKRPADSQDTYGEDRSKRLAISDTRCEPPLSRFDTPMDNRNTYNTLPIKKDFKRDGFKRKSFQHGNGDDFQRNRPDFKRDFDISTRTSAIESLSAHQSNSSNKYPSPTYDGRGGHSRVSTRHALDVPPARRDTAPVNSIQPSREKEPRYTDRSTERATERSSDRSTMALRGSRDERDNRRIETNHRSSKDNNRGPSSDHRYNGPSSSIKGDSGRYGDRSTADWHPPGISQGKSCNSMNSAVVATGAGTTEPRDSWSKTSDSWRQIETNSNDRWSGGPLYPPGASSSTSLSGRPSSGSYMNHRFNMSSTARKY